MTQQEFENRVNMQVSSTEFDAINVVYMNSDLDKDEFCKMWSKMNESRISKAIAAAKEEEEKAELYMKVSECEFILSSAWKDRSDILAVSVLGKKRIALLESIGIEITVNLCDCKAFKYACSVISEIYQWKEEHKIA